MDFLPLQILTFLSLTLVVSHASLSPEAYWKSMLPNTPMPKSIKDSLPPTAGGMKQEITISLGLKRPALNYTVTAEKNHEHHKHNGELTIFFLQKDLHQGKNMTLQFTKSKDAIAFLPREIANSIPFSSNKISKILCHFALKKNSKEAKGMKKIIQHCEKPAIKGEEKYCATSIESMIDFVVSKLGVKLEAFTTEAGNDKRLQYSIAEVKKLRRNYEKGVLVCHKQRYYHYAIFYCHKTQTSEAYIVSLVGKDGTQTKAIAVCHLDTSFWNPKHIAFQMLKVKPGTSEVCHFLPRGHILWITSK